MENIELVTDEYESVYIKYTDGEWYSAVEGFLLGMIVYELDFTYKLSPEKLESIKNIKHLKSHILKEGTPYIIQKNTIPITFN